MWRKMRENNHMIKETNQPWSVKDGSKNFDQINYVCNDAEEELQTLTQLHQGHSDQV